MLSTPRHERDSNSQLKVIDTDCTGSYKSNYHTIITGFKEEEFKNISPIDFYIKLCPAVVAILDL